ncbi:alanine racemase [Neptunicella marina]|uniref:Alanine racemase n=1 Tax=Neptunicella marina TaxID=2125989 RepID=A0A8J6IR38_9ALTE|nr:alanine racemase [Neptunicella marina]MBC3764387.1 alanine racemase [Neptunicella marina]
MSHSVYRSRPARAVIDLNAIRCNYQLACEFSAGGKVLAVIKADAYGHGAIAVAKALSGLAPAFGVACVEEAIVLRDAGIAEPILLLEGPFHPNDIQLAAKYGFWLMLENTTQVDWFLQADISAKVGVWLKVDTGMHRLGLLPHQVVDCYSRLQNCNKVAGDIVLTSHFACADELDNPFTSSQLSQFESLEQQLSGPASLANSAAILGWPSTQREWARAGLILFGISPFEDQRFSEQLKPAMTLESQIISLRTIKAGDVVGYSASWQAERDTVIATIAIGYADGYPRVVSSDTQVLVNGQAATLAGRISMDMLAADVTHIPNVAIGDRVELWGRNLSVAEVAARATTISYDLLAAMPARVPREYLQSACWHQ